ncbi:MAG: oligopeptide/dipeptide ABC transporter ATP-binding protein [bacterium]|jgi:oligopeptide/dipeptide ABC transporter ATP-binding protein
MPDALLELEQVSKEFVLHRSGWTQRATTFRAVNQVSWKVHPGEALGVVGESGCGKSTVARMAVGLEPPTSGTIRFKGKPLSTWLEQDPQTLRRSVQMVFQDPAGSLNPRQRIREILDLQLKRLTRLGPEQRRQRIREVLQQVQLPESTLERFPHEFSGGQAQRISIARALVSLPELLLLDEPVSALDVSVQAQILLLLENMRQELGVAYVFISHDLAVVEQLCPNTVVMYAGAVAEQGPTERLFRHRRHPYTDLLVRSVPVPGTPLQLKTQGSGEVEVLPGCSFRNRCPRASETCAQVPELQPVSETSPHLSACHYPLDEDV